MNAGCSPRAVIVILWPCAAENRNTFRRQIRFQRLPRQEGDILALDIGADRIGRKMEGQAGAFAGFGRRRQRHRADLQKFWFEPLEPFRGRAGIALLLLDPYVAEIK